MRGGGDRLPAFAEYGLVPLFDLAIALLLACLVLAAIGVSPLRALDVLVAGAFGSASALGYTLYYATHLVFTGLAVAIAYQAGLFNIGGEGQAILGGIGASLLVLACDATLPGVLLVPLATLAAAVSGAAWAAIPAVLQTRRGSHVVITTILLNFVAAALLVYLLVNWLIAPGSMSPETRSFSDEAALPLAQDLADALGWTGMRAPLNASSLLALAAAFGLWLLVWRTRFGYELRVFGANPEAARYAGIDGARITRVAMSLSGALAGLVAINELLGVQHRLLLNFSAGYGFAGIAVALMGRAHPAGILLSSLLFGALYQGGTELTFEIPDMSREMVTVIQGLVILVSGALAGLSRPLVRRLLRLLAPISRRDARHG